MSERVMAKVVKLDDVLPHDNADSLELAKIGGWQCVVEKGKYKKDDLVVFCEIDSWVPHELAPFLSKGKEPKKYNGVKGEKLRTIRLRGEISQGLVLSINEVFSDESIVNIFYENNKNSLDSPQEGLDVSQLLNIQKYEPPVPAQLSGQVKGNFPSLIKKTDQERIQNLSKQFEQWKKQELTFCVQEKLEGSSMTCYLIDGVFGVCSRNIDLKEDLNNTFWKVARELDIESKMRKHFGTKDVAIQGELIGEGVHGNIYKLKGNTFRLFDIWDCYNQSYMKTFDLMFLSCKKLETVPFVNFDIKLSEFEKVEELLEYAKGFSLLNPKQQREGLVFKCRENPNISFKVINNDYLLKSGG